MIGLPGHPLRIERGKPRAGRIPLGGDPDAQDVSHIDLGSVVRLPAWASSCCSPATRCIWYACPRRPISSTPKGFASACRSRGARAWSRSIRASCRASCRRRARGDVNPADFDLVALAMQEPQYRSPGVRELLGGRREVARAVHVDHEHAAAALPRAHSGTATSTSLRDCYTDPTVWDGFDPALMTLCSPDPQAFRPPEEKVNVLQVEPADQLQGRALPVGRAHGDAARPRGRHLRRAPRRPWSCRSSCACTTRCSCRSPSGACCSPATTAACRPARSARSARPCTAISTQSRDVYDWVSALCRTIGAAPRATRCRSRSTRLPRSGLARPSSAARALAGGAPNIERVDSPGAAASPRSAACTSQRSMQSSPVEARLAVNRRPHWNYAGREVDGSLVALPGASASSGSSSQL